MLSLGWSQCQINNTWTGQMYKSKFKYHSAVYITHKNIPVILLVNTTSRDIKYYAYIPNIWREGKKVLYKMDISLILRDIVDILPISPMPTLIMWLPWRLLVLFSPTVTKTFDFDFWQWPKLFIGIAGLVVWYLASGAQGPRINTRLGHSRLG